MWFDVTIDIGGENPDYFFVLIPKNEPKVFQDIKRNIGNLILQVDQTKKGIKVNSQT